MPFLTRDQILGVVDIKKETVQVPEWGGEVFVKLLSGTERDEFEDAMRDGDGKLKRGIFRAATAASTICDENGHRLFTMNDIAVLGEKSSAALDRVVEAAAALNKFGEKEIEGAEKNSESGQSADSGTSSPSSSDVA